MSRKTKKEKIVADLKRKIAILESNTSPLPKLEDPKKPVVLKPVNTDGGYKLAPFPQKTNSFTPKIDNSYQEENFSYVAHDLKRILSITLFVITTQFVFYLGIERNYFQLISKLIH